jgi:polysaccharide deacetylase 2 family uncharacterized protein YibQ
MSPSLRAHVSFGLAIITIFMSFALALMWGAALMRGAPAEAAVVHVIAPPAPPKIVENITKIPLLHPASLPAVAERTPDPYQGGTGRIAVIIDDMGLNVRQSARVIDLPTELTLSFLPYANNVQTQVDRARALGHEIMLHLPMESVHRDLPAGPGALTMTQDSAARAQKLTQNLTAFRGYTGVNNHMGSRLTADAAAMRQVMDALADRDVYFVDSVTSGRSVAYEYAARAGLPRGQRDVFLDHDIGQAAVWRALHTAEALARRRGSAVVIGHPKSDTIKVLQAWLPRVASRGIKIVPMSSLLYDGVLAADPVLKNKTQIAVDSSP